MKTMACWARAGARVSQRRFDAACARPRGGRLHIGEIRWRMTVNVLKTDSFHVSAATGPALKQRRGPRTATMSIRGCRAYPEDTGSYRLTQP